MRKGSQIGFALCGALLALTGKVLLTLEWFKPIAFVGDVNSCTLIEAGRAVEDLARIGNTPKGMLYLGSGDERDRLISMKRFGPAKTPQGTIQAIMVLGKDTADVADTTMLGFPSDVAFHPHGIFYYPPRNELYIINHAYAQGGERIDVFSVDASVWPVQLTYTFSPYISERHGVLNDLVVKDDDELFATVWLTFSQDETGNFALLRGKLRYWGNVLSLVLGLKTGQLLRCKGYRSGSDGSATCTNAMDRGTAVMPNGIAFSPEKDRILVSDPIAKEVLVFKVHEKDGSLKLARRIVTTHAVDNITPNEWDSCEEYFFGSFSAKDYLLRHMFIANAEEPLDISIASGAYKLGPAGPSPYEETPILFGYHPLKSSSVVASVSNETLLFGSAVHNGVMLCPLR
ncbi:unnamed protein product [Chrysoparadoxa australica]